MQNEYLANKSLPAVVHVRIRRGIVQIPVGKSSVQAIVPVPAETGKHAPYIPKTKTSNLFLGANAPKPPKEVF